jgi:hypothetical protein
MSDGSGAIDLLRPSRRATTFRERGAHALGGERAYVQAFTPTSVFFLTRPRAGPVSFRLTCRVPGGGGEVTAGIEGGAESGWRGGALEDVRVRAPRAGGPEPGHLGLAGSVTAARLTRTRGAPPGARRLPGRVPLVR